MHKHQRLLGKLLLTSIAIGVAIGSVHAQATKPLVKTPTASKWADIDKWPDFTTGEWTTGMGINDNLRPGGGAPAVAPPAGPLPDQSGIDKAPLKPEIAAKVKEAKRLIGPGGTAKPSCEPEGIVIAPGSKFFFGKDIIVISGDQGSSNQLRRIYMNQTSHNLDDIEPTYFGHSIGHWEGNTLVVDTVAIREEAKLTSGVPLESNDTHIVERYRLLNPNTLERVSTIDNPDLFTKPWTTTTTLKRKTGTEFTEAYCWKDRESYGEGGSTDLTPPK